jgi:protein-tyrosine phosphatase
MAIDARDDAAFRILDECLAAASEFISAAHARGAGVLVHCMAGVNRFAACISFLNVVGTLCWQIFFKASFV